MVRKSSNSGVYVCGGELSFTILQKRHWFIVFHVYIWGSWSFVWGLSPPKPPLWRQDWANLVDILQCFVLFLRHGFGAVQLATVSLWSTSLCVTRLYCCVDIVVSSRLHYLNIEQLSSTYETNNFAFGNTVLDNFTLRWRYVDYLKKVNSWKEQPNEVGHSLPSDQF